MRKMKIMSMFVLLTLLLNAVPGTVLAQKPLPPQVTKTISKDVPQPPEDWIVVRDETSGHHNERGQWVTIREIEYRDPTIHPLAGAGCDAQSSVSIEYSHCTFWYIGAYHTTVEVGGVTENLYTRFTRYQWHGAGGGNAWRLDYTKVWWTRLNSHYWLGQTRMWIADTSGSVDCDQNPKTYAEYNDYFTPFWDGNTTYVYKYITSGRDALASPDIKPRIHQIGSTPINYDGFSYGTLPEHRHRFYQSNYSG